MNGTEIVGNSLDNIEKISRDDMIASIDTDPMKMERPQKSRKSIGMNGQIELFYHTGMWSAASSA